jgi:hypothetical protein
MARINTEDAAATVRAKLQSSGGEMSHNALVQALEADGAAREAAMLMALRRAGLLTFRVDYDETAQVSTLMVSIPA